MIARPPFIPRTEERELHQCGNLLERHKDALWYATEKVNGFSFSFGRVNGAFIASARERLIAPDESSVFTEAVRGLELESIRLPDGSVVQGELVGPRIRGNRYGLFRLQFLAFDMLIDVERMGFNALQSLCRDVGLSMVPLLAVNFHPTPKNVANYANGQSTISPMVQREGAVFRTMVETVDPFQGRASFKVFATDLKTSVQKTPKLSDRALRSNKADHAGKRPAGLLNPGGFAPSNAMNGYGRKIIPQFHQRARDPSLALP